MKEVVEGEEEQEQEEQEQEKNKQELGMDEYIAMYGDEKSVVMVYCFITIDLINETIDLINETKTMTIDHNNRLFISIVP